jgi:hypothetical protein
VTDPLKDYLKKNLFQYNTNWDGYKYPYDVLNDESRNVDYWNNPTAK